MVNPSKIHDWRFLRIWREAGAISPKKSSIYIGNTQGEHHIGIRTSQSGKPIKEFVRSLDGSLKYLSEPHIFLRVPLEELARNSRIYVSFNPLRGDLSIEGPQLYPGCSFYRPNGSVAITEDSQLMEPVDSNARWSSRQNEFVYPDGTVYEGDCRFVQGRFGRDLSNREISELVVALEEIGLEHVAGINEPNYVDILRGFVEYAKKRYEQLIVDVDGGLNSL